MKAQWIVFILLTVTAIAVAGCATPGPSLSPTPQIASPTTQVATATAQAATPTAQGPSPIAQAPLNASVTIKDFSFQPGEVTIAQGGTVTWTNEDSTTHTVKFSDAESSGLQNGGTYSKKFDTAGSFDYSCGIHPTMKGTVKVV